MSQLKYLVIYLSLLVALVLMILPLPDWVQIYRPNWIALTLIYWSMALPKRVGLWFAFFTGIILDTSLGTLLGQHTLPLLLIIYINLNLYQRIRVLALALLPRPRGVGRLRVDAGARQTRGAKGPSGRNHHPRGHGPRGQRR